MSFIATALLGFFLLSANPAAAVSAPGGKAAYSPVPTFTLTLTGYNASSAQTDADPEVTANGGPANPEVVAARSRDLAEELPFGTVIEIMPPTATSTTCGYSAVAPAIGYRVITDTMNARYRDHVDILLPSVDASRALGVCAGTEVRIVGRLNLTHVGDLPKSQEALAALMDPQDLALSR